MGNIIVIAYNWLMGITEANILLLGLEGAGKTAVLQQLNSDQSRERKSDVEMFEQDVRYRNFNLKMLDIGRQNKMLPFWRTYFENARAIIYVIDSIDKASLVEAKYELKDLCKYWEKELKNTVLYVFANKKDLPDAMNITEVIDMLDLHAYKSHSWHIQSTCATNGDGLYSSLEWITNALTSPKMKKIHLE